MFFSCYKQTKGVPNRSCLLIGFKGERELVQFLHEKLAECMIIDVRFIDVIELISLSCPLKINTGTVPRACRL